MARRAIAICCIFSALLFSHNASALDGKVLYYARWQGHPPYGFYALDAATGAATLLLEQTSADFNYSTPNFTWSIDGKQVLYTNTNRTQLWAMNNNGTNPHLVYEFKDANDNAAAPEWHPTTQGIIWRIYGTGPIHLTNIGTGADRVIIDLVALYGTKSHSFGCTPSLDGRVVYAKHSEANSLVYDSPLIFFDANMSNPVVSYEFLWTHGTIVSNDGTRVLNLFAGDAYSHNSTTSPAQHHEILVHKAEVGTEIVDVIHNAATVGEIPYFGFAPCMNNNDYIVIEATSPVKDSVSLYVLNWKTKQYTYVPKPPQTPTNESFDYMGTGSFWYGQLPAIDGPSVTLSSSNVALTLSSGSQPATRTITITNGGTGTLPALNASVPSGASSWLSAAVTGGASNSQTLSLTIDPSSLSAGSHTATVTISGSGVGSVTVGVSLDYGFSFPAPSVLNAQIQLNGTSVVLTWQDNSSDETGFVVERSVGGGAYAQAGTTNANVNTYTDANLSNGDISWRVKAVKNSESSVYSNTATATITGVPIFAVTKPNAGDVVLSGDSLDVQWIVEQDLIPQIVVYLSTDGGLGYTQLNVGTGVAAADGDFKWQIPAGTVSDNAIVRLEQYGNSSVAVVSPTFRIVSSSSVRTNKKVLINSLQIAQTGSNVLFHLPNTTPGNFTLEVFDIRGARAFSSVGVSGGTMEWRTGNSSPRRYVARLTNGSKVTLVPFVWIH